MPAAAAILDGMPDARDLHRLDSGGQTMILAGPAQLFQVAGEDTAMRNVAVAVLRQLGFGGTEVAAVMGLTPNYVATLRQRSLREGTAGLIRAAGRPAGDRRGRGTGPGRGGRPGCGTRRSRGSGVNKPSTVLRGLGRAHVQEALPLAEPAAAEPGAGEPQAGEPRAGEPRAGEPRAGEPQVTEPEQAAAGTGLAPGSGPAAGGFLLPLCGGDAAARVLRADGRRGGTRQAPPGRRTWRC